MCTINAADSVRTAIEAAPKTIDPGAAKQWHAALKAAVGNA